MLVLKPWLASVNNVHFLCANIAKSVTQVTMPQIQATGILVSGEFNIDYLNLC